MATTAPAKFRIDVDIHNLLMNSSGPPSPPPVTTATLPEPIFPQYPELLRDPGPDAPPTKRDWTRQQVWRKVRGWLIPYIRSRVMPGEFHPITAYLFLDYKCNLDCWYCWAFNNKVKGMTEDIAKRTIDWLHGHGCRVLALMGGEPLPSLPKALIPAQKNLEYLIRKQYGYGYMVFFNMNICRNNLQDIRQLTEYARAHRLATDYHINETPMLEQDGHFKHLYDNPTYIRPEDWRAVDELIDWIIEKNKQGYQMVNSVQRLQEMKAFVRMSSGVDVQKHGWYGDGTGDIAQMLASTSGIVHDSEGGIHFTDWNCRAGQNNVIIRTDGTVAPCFPMYGSSFDWGNIDAPKFEQAQLQHMKKTCQQHCFSTLNHNLGYCYNDARVIKWVWKQVVTNKMQGGARSFED